MNLKSGLRALYRTLEWTRLRPPTRASRAFCIAKFLSPAGFIAPAQSASRPLPLANPFRHFPNASNPKRAQVPGANLSKDAHAALDAAVLAARFSHVDLDDASVSGGKMDNVCLGINWWATRRWKASFGWAHTRLDRSDLKGNSDSFLTRLQWIF